MSDNPYTPPSKVEKERHPKPRDYIDLILLACLLLVLPLLQISRESPNPYQGVHYAEELQRWLPCLAGVVLLSIRCFCNHRNILIRIAVVLIGFLSACAAVQPIQFLLDMYCN